MRTRKEVFNEFCSESNRYPTKEEALYAMKAYGEEVREACAQCCEEFTDHIRYPEDCAKAIRLLPLP